MRFKMIAGALLAFALPVLTANVQAAEYSAKDREDIGVIVHDYILQHPEILREALVNLAKKEKEEKSAGLANITMDQKGDLYTSKYQAVVGNPEGKTVLVEFFDYNCGYCKKSIDDITTLMKQDPKLKVILKDFPVLGPGSLEASKVASAVRNQLKGEAFWDFHKTLLLKRSPNGVGKAEALEVAKSKGVDMDKLAKDMASEDVSKGISEVMAMADKLGLTGTPSFVVGGEVVIGAVGYTALNEKLTNTAACGKSVC